MEVKLRAQFVGPAIVHAVGDEVEARRRTNIDQRKISLSASRFEQAGRPSPSHRARYLVGLHTTRGERDPKAEATSVGGFAHVLLRDAVGVFGTTDEPRIEGMTWSFGERLTTHRSQDEQGPFVVDEELPIAKRVLEPRFKLGVVVRPLEQRAHVLENPLVSRVSAAQNQAVSCEIIEELAKPTPLHRGRMPQTAPAAKYLGGESYGACWCLDPMTVVVKDAPPAG